MEFNTFLSFLGSFSIGALLLDWLRIRIEKRKRENEKRHELKERRYKAIILLMHAMLNFEKSKRWLLEHGKSDIIQLEDVIAELNTEWEHMILYANDDTFRSMGEFLKNSTLEKFWETALEMRKDLYGIKTNLSLQQILTQQK